MGYGKWKHQAVIAKVGLGVQCTVYTHTTDATMKLKIQIQIMRLC